MIRSMTGYGEAATQREGVSYFLEVRSLNSKYFKTTVRLPDEFQGLEAEIEAALRRRLARGSVTVKATCTDASAKAAQVINHEALDAYVEQIKRSGAVSSGEVAMDLAPILGLPGVLQQPANEEERTNEARQVFMDLLDQACVGLVNMRLTEGAALAEDLRSQRDVIASRLEIVRGRAPAVVEDYEKRLRARIDSLLADAGVSADAVDIIREIASFAERSDIAEEVTRLLGHIEQFSNLIESTDSGEADPKGVGRTLDFLAQEMLREANTMASKASDAELARAIVEIKGAIDRIKEQVQNVE